MGKSRMAIKLGKAIKQAREKAGMVQKDVARRVGVTKADVSLWEQGNRMPQMRNFIRLARLFPELIDTLRELAQPDGLKPKKEETKQ